MNLSLRNRIQLLIAATVAAVAGFVLLVIATLLSHQLQMGVHGEVRATGVMLSQLIRERSNALQDQCRLLARQQPIQQGLVEEVSRPALTELRDCIRQMHADGATLLTHSGRRLASVRIDPSFPPPLMPQGERRAARRGAQWSGVVTRSGRLMLAVSVPVRHRESGQVIGTLIAYHRIDSHVAQELKDALGTEVAFLNGGRVVGASLDLPDYLLTPEGDPYPMTIAGTRYYALYSPLPSTVAEAGEGFVVLKPYMEAMGLYLWVRALLICAVGIALVLALVGGAITAQGITKPLESVVEAARTLKDGTWPDPIKVTRSDEVGLLQSVFNEMTQAVRSAQERLLALLDTDPLTDMDNHRRFQERLEQESSHCSAAGIPFSLLLMDVDRFHDFNRKFGHGTGDAALLRISTLVRELLPDGAHASRYGGDEIAILLPRHNVEQAAELAERIRVAAQSGSVDAEDPETGLTLSIGCAEYGKHTRKVEGLLLAVELAVSQAKELGRNRVCRFDSLPGADGDADPYQVHRFLKEGSLSTIQALAAAIDAKDPYTKGHSHRVADYASALAEYVGLPPETVDLIHVTGTLHDVGKIGVPDAILQKPRELNDDERAVIETHPVLGEVIIRKAPQLHRTLPGVRSHHERWDGMGYPDGLTGEEIPLMARVLAVADAFDAITSDRPYRKGLSVEVALHRIAEGAGTQFDPEMARAFVRMMREQMTLPMAA